MANTSEVICLSKDTANKDAILDNLTHIHAACIEYDHTEATFLPPLEYSKILSWWNGRLEEISNGTRLIWIEILPISSRKSQLESPLENNQPQTMELEGYPGQLCEVAGVVSLYMPVSETGSFRGEVHKLLVSPNHRQKGLARKLMAELEKEALKRGRTNLMLDTEVGSPAETVYPKLGYIRVGVVPDYGFSPIPGKMCDEVWFYKNLKNPVRE